MTLVLLFGALGVFVVLFFKRPILKRIGKDNIVVSKLKNTEWFQNHWFTGLFLFVMNGILFFSTCLVLYVLMYFTIPFVHLFVMFLAVISSIFLWASINKSWSGTKGNRLKMGVVGSSFYLFLLLIFVYLFVTLHPSYPGEDVFMRAIGLVFAIVVATVAFMACFVITGFSNKQDTKGEK